MKYQIRQIFCRPWTLNGLSLKLIESHYENNYGGAVRRLNAITEQREAQHMKTLVGVLAAVLVAGCDVQGAPQVRDAPPSWYDGILPILHFKKDAARERGWALTPEGLVAVDFRERRTLAFVPLPGWVWVGTDYACPPDLVVGPRGEVLVSSNVVPTLWHVDPVSFEVTRHEPALDADASQDFGFSALSYSSKQGVYVGVSSPQGVSWRIDPSLKQAHKVLGAAHTSSCSG